MRTWRRRKRYAATVITLLALVFAGIGTVLAILATSVLRPLPFARHGELLRASPLYDGLADLWSLEELQRSAALVPEVSGFAAMTPLERRDVVFRGGTLEANVVTTTANFFPMLGVATAAPSGVPGSAIVSSRLVNRLGLSPGQVVGSSIVIAGKPLTIAAVIDRTQAFPADGEIWFSDAAPGRMWLGFIRTRGKMAPDAMAIRFTRAFKTVYAGEGYVEATMRPIAEAARPLMGGAQRMLLMGIAVFSIVAILNYGLLGIGEARRRAQEFAVRVAVGGTRAQVMRGLLLDQLSLVFVAFGVALVALTAVALRAYDGRELVQALLHLSPEIWLALAGFVALLMFASVLPTRVGTNIPEIEVLRRVNARGSRFEKVWNGAFVSLQFGVTSFLLIVGGVAFLGLIRDRHTAYGFDERNATIAKMWFSKSRQEPGHASLTVREFVQQVDRAFPGSATVWTQGGRAMTGAQYKLATDVSDPFKGKTRYPVWTSQDVTPGFFDVMGIPIIAGRPFTAADDASAAPVIIVTARAARDLWGTTNVIGRRMRFGEDDGAWRTVVGVAADAYPIEAHSFYLQARQSTWATSYSYRPLAQVLQGRSPTAFSVIVRGPNFVGHAATLQALLDRVAPAEKFARVATLDQFLDTRGEVARGASTMRLLFIFGACGLVLGVIGAMILIDDVVRSRTTEFGIRRALGAPSGSLVTLASRETLVAGVSGVLVGAILGARFGPVVGAWLKGTVAFRLVPVVPLNWSLVAATVVGLITVLALGTMLRAIRAARLDPAAALRVS